ncbi:zinc ribbon domain-containing protein [Clostridium hydrogenum]|uniref:zinc ribbon domain-containing protein n=1 Tax=Clostridium hydrogenum TaxID=2855764 RepID=UPI001F17D0C1|nr:zinc ribbon domain-containing protein [Clostridium hydrogenum]
MYLLTGLIYCGHCGSAMQGNRRKPKDKPKYVSYRCGCRVQKRNCDNKEIRKEYVEEFVLTELEKNIINDKAVPILVEKINKHIVEQSKNEKESAEIMLRKLSEVKKQIDNIVVAITNGFCQSEFKAKMEELEERKSKLEFSIKELEVKNNIPSITEEQVKNMFAMFKVYVLERNIPECKKVHIKLCS